LSVLLVLFGLFSLVTGLPSDQPGKTDSSGDIPQESDVAGWKIHQLLKEETKQTTWDVLKPYK